MRLNVDGLGLVFASMLALSACNSADDRNESQRDASVADMAVMDSSTADSTTPNSDGATAADAGGASDTGQREDAAVVADSGATEVDGAAPAPTGELVISRDVDYPPPEGVVSDMAKMDIYRRDDGVVRPLMFFVHGGSWVGGDKGGIERRIAPWWVDQGYVVAGVNFRLASRLRQSREVLPRDQAQDIAAALAHILSQADTYQIKADEVVVVGYSSGAHLVALLGTDERILRNAGVNETHVRGTISLDVHAYDVPYALELMVGSVVEGNMPLIRHLFGETEAEQLEGSPINFVDGWASPALVISVDADPAEQGTHGYIVSRAAERYITALREAGHQADTLHDESETHSTLVGGFGEAGDLTTEATLRFIESIVPAP
ncbi:MAG: alpha/beta hydrolase [Bradymonadia bacterium]